MPTGYSIDGLTPREVISPITPAEVAQELARAAMAGLAVTPWGGGTQIGLGNPPKALDLVLNTSHLNRLLEHSPEDLTATVQAGTPLAELQRALGKHGQQVAIEAPLPDRATIGGILAAGATGPRRFAYGNRREQVIGIKVAHPDGALTKGGGKVVKNVTGYEMTKLYAGSLGTLGVIVEASFKLAPLPVTTATIVGVLPSIVVCPTLVQRLLAAHLQPLAMDTLNALVAPANAPELHGGQWAFAAEFAGSRATVERQIRDASSIMTEQLATSLAVVNGAEAAGFWAAVRDYGRGRDGGLVLRASVLPSHVPELLASVPEPQPAVIARAGNGIAYLYWPGGPAAGGAEFLSPLAGESQRGGYPTPEQIQALREKALGLGGSLVIEDAPIALKQVMDVWGPPGSSFPSMRRLKDLFDPHGVLNPGRFLGGI